MYVNYQKSVEEIWGFKAAEIRGPEMDYFRNQVLGTVPVELPYSTIVELPPAAWRQTAFLFAKKSMYCSYLHLFAILSGHFWYQKLAIPAYKGEAIFCAGFWATRYASYTCTAAAP